MTALIIIGVIVAYFGIGMAVAIRALPYAWRFAEANWPDNKYFNQAHLRRTSVTEWSVFRVILWPIALPALIVSMAITRHDPERIAEQDREQKRRIAQLERELGIR